MIKAVNLQHQTIKNIYHKVRILTNLTSLSKPFRLEYILQVLFKYSVLNENTIVRVCPFVFALNTTCLPC